MNVHNPGGAVHVAAAFLHPAAPSCALRDGVKAGAASLQIVKRPFMAAGFDSYPPAGVVLRAVVVGNTD